MMTKKIITLLLLVLFFTPALPKTIQVIVMNFGATSPNAHYCLKVKNDSGVNGGCGIPVALGTDYINNFLYGTHANSAYYLRFAYSLTQPYAKWPAKKYWCQIPLTQSQQLIVTIPASGKCEIQVE